MCETLQHPAAQGLGFRVSGLGFGVRGLGFGGQGGSRGQNGAQLCNVCRMLEGDSSLSGRGIAGLPVPIGEHPLSHVAGTTLAVCIGFCEACIVRGLGP